MSNLQCQIPNIGLGTLVVGLWVFGLRSSVFEQDSQIWQLVLTLDLGLWTLPAGDVAAGELAGLRSGVG